MWRFALVTLAGCRSLLGFEEATVVDLPDGPAPDTVAIADGPDTSADGPVEQEVVLVAIGDTRVNSASPNQNFGADDVLDIDSTPLNSVLVQFDLSAIPSTATVSVAELLVTTGNDAGIDCTVHVLLEAWLENQATHLVRIAGEPWMGAGAFPPSRVANPSGGFNAQTPNTTFTSAIDLLAVQGWVTTPASNLGFAISTISNGGKLRSREHVIATTRPMLRVKYVP